MVHPSEVFKCNGRAIKFYIVTGPTEVDKELQVLKEGKAVELRAKIEAHGGRVVQDMKNAEIWIVSSAALKKYRMYCADSPRHRAEKPTFVRECVQQGRLVEEPVLKKKPMRGRYPGSKSSYTDSHKDILCQWMAVKIPDPASGGRLGKRVFQDFTENAEIFPNGRWALAAAHPWSSWRQHYRTHKAELDEMIDEYVKAWGRTADSKGTYVHDRRFNKRAGAIVKDENESSDDDDGDYSSPAEDAVDNSPEFVASEDEDEDYAEHLVVQNRGSPEAGPSRPAPRWRQSRAKVEAADGASAHGSSASAARYFVDLTMDED
ncbi:rap1 myb-like domain-containing protein [Phanerochaete sordida]|uniref:Rap1 myb-like domain-containing protein n=1 Tax=Phanerochaete sordida TaxID=48140 RepID=A0A9P3G4W3_9APHY|nr:rap1 myb-like domain-containing protein [Phanerochaete sordida]